MDTQQGKGGGVPSLPSGVVLLPSGASISRLTLKKEHSSSSPTGRLGLPSHALTQSCTRFL